MFEIIKPMEIEKRSFEIISGILADEGIALDPENELVIKRVIHTTADFDYVNNLVFSEGAVRLGIEALKSGCDIVTDTQMAKSGINKTILGKLGGEVHCFMSDEDVAAEAKARGITRAAVSMEKAARLDKPLIFAIGNAPTALIALDELMKNGGTTDAEPSSGEVPPSVANGRHLPRRGKGIFSPKLIIGVPVGFVNVVESKELIIASPVPHIVARGRKGGSNVAAAIVNSLLYQITR